MLAAIMSASAFGVVAAPADPAPAAAVFAQIRLEPAAAGSLKIIGEVLALAAADVGAELRIERQGGSGALATAQSRTLRLRPGERQQIAETSTSFAAGDRLVVTAIVTSAGIVLSRATLSAGPEQNRGGGGVEGE